MNNELAIFKHGDFTARTITDDNGEIWFVAKDVAITLGYKDSTINNALSSLFAIVPDIWAGKKRIFVRSENGVEQEREMLCLTEQGLYFFLGRSDKKAALPYQMWVAGKVVPSIRKHGFYATPQKVEDILSDPDSFIKVLTAYKEEKAKVAELTAQAEENKPKVIFADAVDASKDSILIRELAKLIAQNGIKIGEKRLYQWLRNHDFLCKYGESWNLPQQRFIEQGLFEIKKTVVTNANGIQIVKPTTKVTGKGQIYFVNGFIEGRFSL